MDRVLNMQGSRGRRIKKKWRSRIRLNNTRKHLGHYDSEEEAYRAYTTELKKTLDPTEILKFEKYVDICVRTPPMPI